MAVYLLFPIVFPFICICYLYLKFRGKRIFFFWLQGHAFGHLAGFSNQYILDHITGPNRQHLLVGIRPSKLSTNSELLTLFTKNYPSIPYWFGVFLYKISTIAFSGRIIFYNEASLHFGEKDLSFRFFLNSSSSTPVQLNEDGAYQYLENIGFNHNKPFVALHVRDNGYYLSKGNCLVENYSTYRNSELSSYLLAINYLIDQGFQVVRVGRRSNQVVLNLDEQNYKKFLFDLPFYKDVPDSVDLFVAKYCSFYISTQSGWDVLAGTVFHKPGLLLNAVAVGDLNTYLPLTMVASKHHFDAITDNRLSLEEIALRGCFYSRNDSDYFDNQIKLRCLSDNEILKSVANFLVWYHLAKKTLDIDGHEVLLANSLEIFSGELEGQIKFWKKYLSIANSFLHTTRLDVFHKKRRHSIIQAKYVPSLFTMF